MSIVVAGDQLILTGPVISGDYDAVESNLSLNPQIRTIILRNSPGGDAPTGYRLGELFRQKSLQTAINLLEILLPVYVRGRPRGPDPFLVPLVKTSDPASTSVAENIIRDREPISERWH
jgi:hypothetical protein